MAKSNYLSNFSTKQTPQSEAIPGSNQVQNSAGGYSYAVSKWDQLLRFLILGTEGGTYYISEKDLTKSNYKSILDCLDEDYVRAIDTIIEISEAGRAPKNDPALFALAVAASHPKTECRQYALNNLSRVARIGTHLFHFVAYVNNMRGWGRALHRAIQNWYELKDPNQLAFQLAKYQSRDGWSHRDLLRKVHPKPKDAEHNNLYKWATWKDVNPEDQIGLIRTFEQLKKASSEKEAIKIITQNKNVQREIIPTEYLKSLKIWNVLYPSLGITALVRNLATMSACGLLVQGNFEVINNICTILLDEERIHKERIHPLQILLARVTYAEGRGFKGSLTWKPVPKVLDALDEMYYKSFKYIEPTGKRYYLGIDVSGSMSSQISGTFLSCCMGAGALAMVTMRTEKDWVVKGFSSAKGGYSYNNSMMKDLNISANMDLSTVVKKLHDSNFGATDCALPMLDALNNKIPIDCFIIYTDSETWFGKTHPIQALRNYRQKMGIDSKLIVVGMASNGFTIADPNDKGSLDIVGFDSSIPSIISSFAKGEF